MDKLINRKADRCIGIDIDRTHVYVCKHTYTHTHTNTRAQTHTYTHGSNGLEIQVSLFSGFDEGYMYMAE